MVVKKSLIELNILASLLLATLFFSPIETRESHKKPPKNADLRCQGKTFLRSLFNPSIKAPVHFTYRADFQFTEDKFVEEKKFSSDDITADIEANIKYKMKKFEDPRIEDNTTKGQANLWLRKKLPSLIKQDFNIDCSERGGLNVDVKSSSGIKFANFGEDEWKAPYELSMRGFACCVDDTGWKNHETFHLLKFTLEDRELNLEKFGVTVLGVK